MNKGFVVQDAKGAYVLDNDNTPLTFTTAYAAKTFINGHSVSYCLKVVRI